MTIATIEAILNFLQDARAQIDTWGITTTHLTIAGVVALIFFFLSLREVLGWYLKTHVLRDELIQTRQQLSLLQKTLEEIRIVLSHSERSGQRSPEPTTEDRASAVGGFQLNH